MYYRWIGLMVSTPVSLPIASQAILPRFGRLKVASKFQRTFNFSLAMAFTCLTFVTILMPESPNQVASICEKYNSANACRVW